MATLGKVQDGKAIECLGLINELLRLQQRELNDQPRSGFDLVDAWTSDFVSLSARCVERSRTIL